jgi:hypothetical protein
MECGSLSGNVEVDEVKKEVVEMKATQGRAAEGFVEVSKMVEEMEKDLPSKEVQVAERKAPSGEQAILQILARAADDHKFLARLAENPGKVLEEYDLTWEEKAALASGDLRRIESWVGKLDERLSTWIWCRLQQEKW